VAAGPLIVTIALIRDRFAGQSMAQVMWIIMGILLRRAVPSGADYLVISTPLR
jgi:hypothetical protein